MIRKRSTLWRFVAVVAVLSMFVAACTSSSDPTTTPAGSPTTTAPPGGGGSSTTAPPATGGEFDTYKVGMISDIVTDNYWNYLGVGASGTVYTQYVNSAMATSLFGIDLPSLEVVPALAAGLPEEAVQDGENWSVTQPLRNDAKWSDGEAITADDIVFTFNTVKDLEMGGSWISAYPYPDTRDPQLISVEAIGDYEVKYTFSSQPGLGTWPHNTGVSGSIMPEHYWAEHVEAAKETDDPAATLFALSGLGSPSAGSVRVAEWEAGSHIRSVANENFSDKGQQVTVYEAGVVIDGEEFGDISGDPVAEYTVGPYFTDQVFSIYADQNLAVQALVEEEVDYWINPLGVSPGLRAQVINAPNLTTIGNPTNGMRYMAFNTTKAPMSYKSFRQALALMIDREFLALSVLQGVAFPMYTMVPEGNVKWHNKEFGAAEKAKYTLSQQQRIEGAVALLKAEGFTWTTEPSWDADRGAVVPGVGMVDPAGATVPTLEVIAPGQAYDPLRATAAIWIQNWLQELGAPARANPTDFNTLVATVYAPVPSTYDMYLLGWSLGNPALPTFHESFLHSRNSLDVDPDGNNAPQFKNDAFDAASDRILSALTEEEAYTAMWEAEAIVADELPYIVLFDTPITESFNNSLVFPFHSTLSGLQFGSGFAGIVSKR